MDFNGSKLGDIQEILNYHRISNITLINGHKASEKDLEKFIIKYLEKDFEYFIFFGNNILEIETNND